MVMRLCLSDHFLCSPPVDQKLADLRLFPGSRVNSVLLLFCVFCVCARVRVCVHACESERALMVACQSKAARRPSKPSIIDNAGVSRQHQCASTDVTDAGQCGLACTLGAAGDRRIAPAAF